MARDGGTKAPWTDEDDVRLCRAYVYAAENPTGDGGENSHYIWVRVHKRYQQILEEEAPAAPPRKSGAIQTHWAAHIRPDVALFAYFMAVVEGEEHAGWTDAECMSEASARFTEARKQAAADAEREYKAEQEQAAFAGTESPPKPRLRPTTFRYERCYEVLRTSGRFMQSVLTKDNEFTAPKKKRRRRSHMRYATDSRSEPVSEDDAERSNQQESLPDRNVRARLEPSADEVPTRVTASPGDRNGEAATMQFVSPAQTMKETAGDHELTRDYLLLKIRALRDRRVEEKLQHRLKLTAELRGVVATISRVAEDLVRGSVTSMAVAAQTEGRPTLAEEVKQDLAFFREERRRLRAELDALGSTRPSGV